MDLGDIRRYLYRTGWGNFPDVLICVSEPEAIRHPLYATAKVGDAKAAEGLIFDLLTDLPIERFESLIGQRRAKLLAVHAVEITGMNAIPRVLARQLSHRFDLPLESGVVQLNRVTHTRADGYHRLAFPPVFDGPLRAADFILVDDFVGQGGTLANLRGFVESRGGTVIGAVSLAGKHRSAQLRLNPGTLQKLKEKHGDKLEEWWISTFGFGLDRLTESEATYLYRSDDFVTITTRLAEARRTRD